MDGQRPCPYCAESIKVEAIKCRHCGTMLEGAPPIANPRDEEHLRYLQTGHYAVAAICGFFSCMPLIHVAVGIGMILGKDTFFSGGHGGAPPRFVGWFFLVIGSLFFLGGWTLTVLLLMAARAIGRRRRHFFCLMVAGISCILMPFGTVLGIFSLVTLNRPSIKDRFDKA